MAMETIANVIHVTLFHPSSLLLSHLHYAFQKKGDIIKGTIVIISKREFYSKKIGFEVLGDYIKVFY